MTPCYHGDKIVICQPTITDLRLQRLPCPTCKRRRWFVRWFQEWYGWNDTCLRCGENWQDGEMCPRPFRPRWRQDNIESAKRIYRRERKALGEG